MKRDLNEFDGRSEEEKLEFSKKCDELSRHVWDIPENIKKAHRIEFDHEYNEYIVRGRLAHLSNGRLRHGVLTFNIPSDAILTMHTDDDKVIYVNLGAIFITLYSFCVAEISIFDYNYRLREKEIYMKKE